MYEIKRRRPVLSSRPYQISIDPGNFCNLRCPGCHTGIKHAEMIKPSFLSFEDYKIILKQFEEFALTVALYNWGEPFLNKHLFEMIEHTRSKQIGSTLHSNLNVFNEQMAVDVVKSGLTHIYVSLDGASEESYQKYRVKGRFEDVITHIKMILEARKRLHSKFPMITWKYLIFEHNKHELNLARQMATELGVDAFESFHGTPKLLDIYDEAKNYLEDPKSFKNMPKVCSSLWSKIYIHADGTVFPCSLAFRERESFGNLIDQELDEVWNNLKYVNARKIFSKNIDSEQLPLPCSACKYYLNNTCMKVNHV